MKGTRFTINWRDAANAIVMTIIANMLMIVMAAAENKFPTQTEFKIGLINSIKYAIIPYLLKNFFTDDVKKAKSILTDKTIEDLNTKIKNDEKIN